MTNIATHPHAAFDRFPQLLDSLAEEFGRDGGLAMAERFIQAEWADFHWDGRFAEMNLGPCESFDEGEDELQSVAIAGYFRGRYYVAICDVDGARRVERMLGLRHAGSYDEAVVMFLARAG